MQEKATIHNDSQCFRSSLAFSDSLLALSRWFEVGIGFEGSVSHWESPMAWQSGVSEAMIITIVTSLLFLLVISGLLIFLLFCRKSEETPMAEETSSGVELPMTESQTYDEGFEGHEYENVMSGEMSDSFFSTDGGNQDSDGSRDVSFEDVLDNHEYVNVLSGQGLGSGLLTTE
jgi:hypothetical protein